MIKRLESVEKRFIELEKELSDPAVVSNLDKYRGLAKEHSDLDPVVRTFRQYLELKRELHDNEELLEDTDEDIQELAREEIAEIKQKVKKTEEELKSLLVPRDPNDEKNVILEIRAGTGGDEAALFVADLFRMYSRYAEQNGWKVEVLSSHSTGIGGFKEIILAVDGKGAYSRLKFESGVHRVQRVPVTESQGRIHTSAITVAVLPEAEEVDVAIDPLDLRVDVYRSSGPGGQSVNTTDSAVRITHLPTGLVVTCQDEKSQHKNKAKAMKVLRSRLLDVIKREQEEKIAEDRRIQVGSGDRSERIRTYNFPQNRLTDHRIDLTLYKLESILHGELDQVIDPLVTNFRAEALKRFK